MSERKKKAKATCPHLRTGCIGEACGNCYITQRSGGAIAGRDGGDLLDIVKEVRAGTEVRAAKAKQAKLRPASKKKMFFV